MKIASIVTYSGTKSDLLPNIKPFFPDDIVNFCDVFCGSGIVSLNVPARHYLINDRCKRIYTFFSVLKDPKLCAELMYRFECSPCCEKTWKDAMSKRDDEDPVTKAWAFVVSYKYSFSYLGTAYLRYPIMKNTKLARKDYMSLQKKCDFIKSLGFRQWLENVTVTNMDALKMIREVNAKKYAFYYCDPPYVGSRHDGYPGDYTEEDFENLLKALASTPHKFMLSCFSTPTVEAYAKKNSWRIKRFNKRGARNGRKTECIFMNYEVKRGLL